MDKMMLSTRGFALNLFNATAVIEFSRKLALQLVHWAAESGDWALQIEQVCIAVTPAGSNSHEKATTSASN